MHEVKAHRSFTGKVQFWEHQSHITKTTMRFSSYVPDGQVKGILLWLSGLTCNEENFITKAGAQRYLAELGIAVVCPDTSPRGLNLPGEHDADDFGSGAGFYVDATTPGYKDHYRMFSYLTEEFCPLIQKHFCPDKKLAISGHSMGGHGALILALKRPDLFCSVSAFAPITNPVECPWGTKAFGGYLGEKKEDWVKYDACHLLKSGASFSEKILIDQGQNDAFLEKQLKPENFVKVAQSVGQAFEVRYRQGYDHSYYYISTFIGEHIKFHAEYL